LHPRSTLFPYTTLFRSPEITFRPSPAAYLHPGRAAELALLGRTPLGHIGQLHPKAAEAYGLQERPVLVGELDLETILKAVPGRLDRKSTRLNSSHVKIS